MQTCATRDQPDRLPAIDGYTIIREIGRGGMGVVYEAHDEKLSRRVALKILPGDALGDESQLARFEQEARAAARLHHTNIVPVFGVGRQEGRPYYVMQYIAGTGLDVVLGELRRLARPGSGSRPVQIPQPHGEPRPAEPHPQADRQENVRIAAANVAQALATGMFAAAKPPARELSATDPGAGETVDFPSPAGPRPSPRAESPVPGSPGSSVLAAHSDFGPPYFKAVGRIGIQVAEAMDYANRQGVLHRDIKPSNLLLEANGNVWVADFGLAKTTEAGDLTQTGQFVGTIRYMAPERFQGRCDVRSDVYSLGLTLYELAALRPAFEESDRFKLIERIRREGPARLKALAPKVPRDLETIIQKSIAPDPAHRYATAAALADDLRRYLEDRPIQARRASRPERVVRWCRRNPWVAAFLAASVIGVIVSSALAVRATLADRASRLAAAATRKERDRAESEAAIAKAVNEFFNKDVLAQAAVHLQTGPSIKPDPDITVRTALDRSASKIGERFASQPLVEASIRHTIGEAYFHLGLYAKAFSHLERARDLRRRELGEDHPDTLETIGMIGAVYLEDGKLSEADPLLLRVMEGLSAALGAEHLQTLAATHRVAQLCADLGKMPQAEQLLLRLQEIYDRKLGAESVETLDVTISLASVYAAQGKLESAERLLTDALKRLSARRATQHPYTLTAMNVLAGIYESRQKGLEAERLWKEILEKQRPVLGDSHPERLATMALLGTHYAVNGRVVEAEPLLLKALAGGRSALDRNHGVVVVAVASLAGVYVQKGEMAKVGPLLAEALQVARTKLGPDHILTAQAAENLGSFYLFQRDFAKAERPLREHHSYLVKHNPEDWGRFAIESKLGFCLICQKKYREAEGFLL
ncbi:MAG: tetratricopeptide repeat protein [Isosphaeraceae bacterium]